MLKMKLLYSGASAAETLESLFCQHRLYQSQCLPNTTLQFPWINPNCDNMDFLENGVREWVYMYVYVKEVGVGGLDIAEMGGNRKR